MKTDLNCKKRFILVRYDSNRSSSWLIAVLPQQPVSSRSNIQFFNRVKGKFRRLGTGDKKRITVWNERLLIPVPPQ